MSILLALLLFPSTLHFKRLHPCVPAPEKPVRRACVVRETPFFQIMSDDGTDYLLMKGNTVFLIRAGDARSMVRLPTGQCGVVGNPAIGPAGDGRGRVSRRHAPERKPPRTPAKDASSPFRENQAPAFRY
jgi:hypothetical protein